MKKIVGGMLMAGTVVPAILGFGWWWAVPVAAVGLFLVTAALVFGLSALEQRIFNSTAYTGRKQHDRN